MKKWWGALGIEIFLLVLIGIGFVFYRNDYNEKMKIIVAKQQEYEDKLQQQEKVRKELEEKVLEENRIERMKQSMIANCEKIDKEFADWLYANYEESCENIVVRIENLSYEDKCWYEETGKSIFVLYDEWKGLLDGEMDAKDASLYVKDSSKLDYICLSFAGDISFANDYAPAQNYNRSGIDGAFSIDVQERMKEADIFMLNNEFCYTMSTTPLQGKKYTFRAEPEKVRRLEEMGVDIVSIANNHAYDYGEQGFLDTMETLSNADMPYVGGGKNLDDARKNIVYFVINGLKIGYIAATQVERQQPIFTQPATAEGAGVVRCFEPDLVNEMIEEADLACDFVIVYPHWGTELVKSVQEDQQELAYSFIDKGADVIVGGHPHCLQGVEYYKDVPIFYSLSNFSFSSKSVDSCILNLEVTIDGIQSARFIPCRESGGTTYQCEKGAQDYMQIINTFNTYSVNAHVDEEGYVTQRKLNK